MDHLHQAFSVRFTYNVFFTEQLFNTANPLFADFLRQQATQDTRKKLLFVVDSGVEAAYPSLLTDIKAYFGQHPDLIELVAEPLVIPGGEVAKNEPACVEKIVDAVDRYGIDRHSYVAAIGGGSVLDMVGYAAGISHRGIRHIRIPTTVLSQNDSGVGVKNGVNYRGKKNFSGDVRAARCGIQRQHLSDHA